VKRNVTLEEISDGRLYGGNDMVKADCHGCKGCHKCCTGMGNSVLLDPYDIYRLRQGLGKTLAQLLAEETVELSVTDGVILPNMKMAGEEERCAFLDGAAAASTHTGPASAACSRWGGSTRTAISDTSSRQGSAGRPGARR
jgi:hypothetical protein